MRVEDVALGVKKRFTNWGYFQSHPKFRKKAKATLIQAFRYLSRALIFEGDTEKQCDIVNVFQESSSSKKKKKFEKGGHPWIKAERSDRLSRITITTPLSGSKIAHTG